MIPEDTTRDYSTHPLTYAGVGSRETPGHVLSLMTGAAYQLAENGWLLRSGAAGGADRAFEAGCDKAMNSNGGIKEIYLPWQGFENRKSNEAGIIIPYHPDAELIASRNHPRWDRCSPGARKLHTRNVFQVLGTSLAQPADMLLCWTPGAQMTGGTAMAIRIAHKLDVPVFNMADPHAFAAIETHVKLLEERRQEAMNTEKH